MAYSRETQRQNEALGDILAGRKTKKRVMVGYKGKKDPQGGKTRQSELTDIMKDVRMPWFCPECKKVMKNNRLDGKMWRIYNHCFDCQLQIEHKMRVEGTFEDWEIGKYLQNKKSIIEEQLESIASWREQGDASFVEPVNVDTGFVHIETYKKDPKIEQMADEALEELGIALSEINESIREHNGNIEAN
jgi:ribosomal protein L37AE/L43A